MVKFPEKYKKAKDWMKYNLKQHVVDSTTMIVFGTPILAAMETMIAGMSDEVSLNARMIAAGMVYGGMGGIVSQGRDLWRKTFKITDTTKEKIQKIHDSAYFTLCLSLKPVFYYISGSRDAREIVIGSASSIGLAFLFGGRMGYTIDMFKDLTGLKQSQRVPKFISERSSKIKKGLVATIIAASVGLTAGIYALTPDKKSNEIFQKSITQEFVQNSNKKDLENMVYQSTR